MNRFALLLGAWLGAAAPALASTPWAFPGDLRLRHELTLLADRGELRAPITTWPLPVAGAPALAGRFDALEPGARLHLDVADQPPRVPTFEETPRAEGELGLVIEGHGPAVSGRLELTALDAPEDGKDLRLDGSYAGVRLGNWLLSAGAIPRWWGPGWEGSLILSTNARPVPQIALDRVDTEPFRSPWLSWLGPWSLHLFAGQLESDRAIPDAKLLGARLAFRPTRHLEVGLTRTAQWGGEGRPTDAKSLWNLLVGNDNPGARYDSVTLEDEPGNQLAGADLRWVSPVGQAPYAFYTQIIGEDERNYMPIKHFAQAGLETWGATRGGSWRGYLEFSNTTIQFWHGTPDYNVVYEHHLYRSGYRYRGRVLGHAMDNDGSAISLGLILARHSGSTWSVRARRLELNRDGTNRAAPGGNTVAANAVDLTELALSHTIPLRSLALRWGVSATRAESQGADSDTEIDGWMGLTYRF